MLGSYEIICRYKAAKDKNKIITILAQMCDCEEAYIKDVLYHNGIIDEKGQYAEAKEKKSSRKMWSIKEERLLKEMYAKRIKPHIIAMRLGRSPHAVRNKLHYLGLPQKYRRGEYQW